MLTLSKSSEIWTHKIQISKSVCR